MNEKSSAWLEDGIVMEEPADILAESLEEVEIPIRDIPSEPRKVVIMVVAPAEQCPACGQPEQAVCTCAVPHSRCRNGHVWKKGQGEVTRAHTRKRI